MGKRILLIDESAMLRRIAASVLGAQPSRYEVLAAARATEGFARACNSGVDLILADQRLSILPNDDLTRRLLAEPRTARLPVVLLIGRGVPPPPLETLSPNVVEVLGKPFAPEQLVALVNAITDLTRGGADFAELRARLHPGPRPAVAEPPFRAAVEEAAPTWGLMPTLPLANALDTRSLRTAVEVTSPALLFQRDAGAMSIRATMQQIARENLTGVLRLRPPGVVAVEVFTENGRVVVVTSRDAAAYSKGAAEVLPPRVSPATLEAAVDEQSRSGVPFFLTLGARGLLPKAAAESLLFGFGQRGFASLWTFRPSLLAYDFERLDTLPGFMVRLEPRRETVDEWLLGTLRHLQAGILADLARHEGLVGTPYPRRDGGADLSSLPLTAAERNFCGRINGRNDLPALGKQLDLTPEGTYQMMHCFRCLETLEYRPAPAAFVVTPRTGLRRVLPLPR